MKKFEQIKIYNAANDKEKERYKEELKRRFETQEHLTFPKKFQEKLQKHEIEKSPEIKEFIGAVNKELEKYLQELGLKFNPVPLKNIHIVPDNILARTLSKYYDYPVEWFRAIFDDVNQTIYCKESSLKIENEQQKIDALGVISHEMIHMSATKSFFIDEEKELLPHHSGLHLISSKNIKKSWFVDINEAMTEELNIRILGRIFDEKSVAHYRENDAPYTPQMELLNYIIQEIYEDNKDKYSSPEEVFLIFAKAYFSPRILEPIRLMKNAFGKKGLEYIRSSGLIWAPEGAESCTEVLKKLIKIRKRKELKRKIKSLITKKKGL